MQEGGHAVALHNLEEAELGGAVGHEPSLGVFVNVMIAGLVTSVFRIEHESYSVLSTATPTGPHAFTLTVRRTGNEERQEGMIDVDKIENICKRARWGRR